MLFDKTLNLPQIRQFEDWEKIKRPGEYPGLRFFFVILCGRTMIGAVLRTARSGILEAFE